MLGGADNLNGELPSYITGANISFCRIEREVKCQQIWPVVHRLLNKTPDVSRL